ncbi:Gfo/Idh/MocA family oxidoreductase [Actinoplanes sp. NPDC049596]|uniref:Gfo/Idh/MocA family protein n=1 Tax=unclassified Actinoplanes TaxID=2626549 RepID=UPI0034258C0A
MVGAGGVAQRHARVLSGLPDVQLTGVTDVVQEAASALASAHGAKVLPDVEALLSEGVDAVYVCVPPFAHGPAERAVIAAGVPLFVEKPIGLDRDIATDLAADIAASKLITAVGHHWRYLSIVDKAREILAGREVRLVSGAWLDKVPPVGWWPHRDRSGGPVVEQAAHVLDLARYLVGEVTQVTAMGSGIPPAVPGSTEGPRPDIDGSTVATLRFAGGAVGTLAATCVLGWKERAGLEIFADGLALSVTENGLTVRSGDDITTHDGDPEAARIAVDATFIDAVRGETPAPDIRVPYAEALRTHELALAVAASAATSRTVDV